MKNHFYKLAMAGLLEAGIGSALSSPPIIGIGGVVAIASLINGAKEEKWNEIYVACNLKNNNDETPKLIACKECKVGKIYTFRLPYGLSKKHLEDKKDELETALQARIELTSNKDYTVDLHVIEREFFDENDKQAFLEAIQESKEMEFIIGTLQTGEILKCDFGANFFSTLVCGASGSGKSVWLKCYLLQACIKQMELVIVDLKGVDFHVFKRYKHLRQYATTAEEAEEVLQMVYELMITRYEQLKVAECSSYAEYNQQTESPMNPLILLIDEFSVLIDSKPAKAALFDLLSRCRACNINVILATQSPRANVIEGVLRCNIKQSIVFRCESETDSEVALGEKGNYMAFDKLPVCGRGLFKSGSHLSIFQGFYFTDNNLKKMIE